MYYRNHNEIPAECKHFILEETQEGRIKNVPIHICNELIEEFLELERLHAKLKEFTVQFVNRNGKLTVKKFNTVHNAYAFMDEIIGYGPKKRQDIGIICRQADRIIKVYYKGKYLIPPNKDRIKVRKAS